MSQSQFIKKVNFDQTVGESVVQKYKFLDTLDTEDINLTVPKILRYQNRQLFFEAIDFSNCTSMLDLIQSKDADTVYGLCHNAGAKLALIHQKLEGEGYIHGDFWPANIFITDSDEWLMIDWEPPKRADINHDDYIKGDRELDVASFLFHTAWSFPKSQWYRYIIGRNRWLQSFLLGYTNSGLKLREDKLKQYLQQEIKFTRQNIWRSDRFILSKIIKLTLLGWTILIHRQLRSVCT